MSGTSDRNFDAKVGTVDEVVEYPNWKAPDNPLEYDDIIKRSQCTNFKVNGLILPPGREDSIDFVRGQGYTISNCRIDGNVTIKGAIKNWKISGCNCGGKIEIGQFDNYWFPGREPTSGGVLEWVYDRNRQKKQVKVLLWDATAPTIHQAEVKVVRIPKVVWFPYFLFRYLVVRAKGLRTK